MKLLNVSTKSFPDTFAMVDEADFEWASQWKWYPHADGKTLYVQRNLVGIKGKTVILHRELIKPPAGFLIDHRDGNGLNNQRANLRVATTTQNARNQRKPCTGRSSRYKGVTKVGGRWQAQIGANGRSRYIGMYSTEIEAAIAYNGAALEAHGEFARINVVAASGGGPGPLGGGDRG